MVAMTHITMRKYDSCALGIVLIAIYALLISINDHTALAEIATTQPANIIRLSNTNLTAVIDPNIRRLVFLGRPGGENILWINDMLPENPPRSGYINFGGEKAWLWPQSRWPNDGNVLNWPPRDDLIDTPGFTVFSQNNCTASVISTPSRMAPLRVQRNYELKSSALTIETELIVDLGASAEGWASWSILQLPVPQKIRMTSGKSVQQLANSPFQMAPNINHLPGGISEITPPQAGELKLGADSDSLIAVYPDYQVVFHAEVRDAELAAYQPGERAQIYVRRIAEKQPTTYGRDYLELEFTGPRISNISRDSWLRVSMEIHDK